MTDWPLLIVVALGFGLVAWLLSRVLKLLYVILLAIEGVQSRVFDSHLEAKGGFNRLSYLLEDIKAARKDR